MKIRPKRPEVTKVSRARKKIGKAPGTITYLGRREKSDSSVHVFDYTDGEVREEHPKTLAEIVQFKLEGSTSWIDVVGISDEAFIEELGKEFGLNPLVLEDAINPQQRPKIDEYESYVFGVFKMLYISDTNELVNEHVAFVLFEHCVLVFQEVEKDVFNGVRHRLTHGLGRIQSRKSDYLFFALLDAVIDNYFVVLESINARMDILEEKVHDDPTSEIAHEIQNLKKDVLKIRRYIFPVKELVGRLIESESHLISKDTKLFLRDALDHSIEINETLQVYREMAMSLMEMYMSNMSNKMNEVMKVLTIMASIFIPLTFIAGVYGMNFRNMPELETQNGYFIVLGVMFVLFLAMLVYFKRKRWL